MYHGLSIDQTHHSAYSGAMPAGKHSGIRTNVTLPVEVDAVFAEVAKELDMPKATLLREVLTQAMPMIQQTPKALRALKEKEATLDDVAARLLWDALKGLPR